MRTLASALREMFGVQLYKNNARALLSRILSILNLDWLLHAGSVRGVYELIRTTLWAVIRAEPVIGSDPNISDMYTSSDIST